MFEIEVNKKWNTGSAIFNLKFENKIDAEMAIISLGKSVDINSVKMINQEAQDEKIEEDVLFLNKKFTQKKMAEIAEMCVGAKIGIDTVADFVRYRTEIKKPLKTTRPLKLFVNELIKISSKGWDIRTSIEIMKQHEWQTINFDWIAKKMQKPAQGADLTQFGFAPQNTQELSR